MQLLISILSLIMLAYVALMFFYIFHIYLQKKINEQPMQLPDISVVVAMRNEENTIAKLITSLHKQRYPSLIEIILVDDSSTDETIAMALHSLQTFSSIPFKLLKLNDINLSGKKQALAYGVINATHEVILCTDADCEMNEYWVQSMSHFFVVKKSNLLAGPVCITNGSLLENMQSIEMVALQGLTAAAIFANRPLMCNGANLMFYKKEYLALQHKIVANKNPSGDDVHLLFEMYKHAKKIDYTFDKAAMVRTSGATSLASLINQRSRWAGKINFAVPLHVTYAGAIILLSNVAILFSLILLPTAVSSSAALIILIKFVIDGWMYYTSSALVGKQHFYLSWFCCTFFAYPFYTLAIVSSLFKKKYTWKEREINLKSQK